MTRLWRYAELIESKISIAGMAGSPAKSRAVHRPLLIYNQLLEMESSAEVNPVIQDSIHALDESVLSSLVLQVAGELFKRPDWIERSRNCFELLIANQQPSGAFLPLDSRANPEARWYDEMVLLHAVASYAVRVRDETVQLAVARSAQFHLNEIQPDHATAEPWGLLAFMQYAPLLADQVLHAMSLQYPQGVSGMPLLLLMDVRYGLQRLLKDESSDDQRS